MFGYRPSATVFERQYHVNSTGFAGKDITDGDKIFLPPSAFEQLARMVVEYPMLFEARNVRTGRKTHCGVLEFSSEEGFCYMPFWMMQNLGVSYFKLFFFSNFVLNLVCFSDDLNASWKKDN
jgi:ubiquitin fusion degradation protein 1